MRRLFFSVICLLFNLSVFAQYGTTKQYEFADSSRTHNLKIQVDYPVKGNPVFLRRVRSYIMEALEYDPYSGNASMGRYNGNFSDGQAVIHYYGVGGIPILKKRRAAYEWECMEELREIKMIAENDHYISFEVTVIIGGAAYNPVVSCYGETFRKSDGKKLKIIANPQTPHFKELINRYFPEDMKEYISEPEKDIPIPYTSPYLIQSGVRFVYQKREITAPVIPYVQEDIPFSEIQQYLTDEVKDVLKGIDNGVAKKLPVQASKGHVNRTSVASDRVSNTDRVLDVVDEMPQFPGGPNGLFEYLSKSVKYPVVAEENGVQGRVIVSFIVERDGSVTNSKIVKSVDPALDKEAMRVIRSMPNWTPAIKNGEKVRSLQHITIPFRLGDGFGFKDVQTNSAQMTQNYNAWFVFGTKDELMKQDVLNDGLVLSGNFNRDYFVKIDIRKEREIKLYSKSAKILTSHPASAYSLKPDANGQYVLRIIDPLRFWSTSKYLVVLVK